MATVTTSQRPSARVRVQKFGTFLSNMIMPNIPALIAWGLLTAFFIDVGWTPNADLATMVAPTIHYLLPLLIAATGGRMVHGDRGGVVAAFATMGAIAGSDLLIENFNASLPEGTAPLGQVHMFIGAMILGPLSAWVMKKLDQSWEGKIRAGFEMLVNMFSAGITAFFMGIFGFFVIARLVNAIMDLAGAAVNWLIATGFLPLVSILIEPAKVFFLNNAINHGVLTPLGIFQAAQQGKSIMFLLEANPGPGLGLLLAYAVFGTGMARASAPGAAIIHFLGGIHEIYFPYVLMKPKLMLATIPGGMTGVFINMIFDSGLRAPAAPGSIIAIYAQAATDSYLGITLSWIGAAAVTFAVAALLLKTDKNKDEGDLAAATASMESMKGKKSSVSGALMGAGAKAGAGAGAAGAGAAGGAGAPTGPVHNVVFACDAGMGSSAMGASVLRKKIQQAGHSDVKVVNKAISNLTDEFDIVVSHQDLTDRAKQKTGSAYHVSVDNFMASPRYDEIVELINTTNAPDASPDASAGTSAAPATAAAPAGAAGAAAQAPSDDEAAPEHDVLAVESIVLDGSARTRDDAIREAGDLLVAAGAVEPAYVDSMLDREASVSTHMGKGLAIPHGTNEAKGTIKRTAISFVRYPEGIDWKGKNAEFVIGIAGQGNDHLQLLSKIATIFTSRDEVERLRSCSTPEQVRDVLNSVAD